MVRITVSNVQLACNANIYLDDKIESTAVCIETCDSFRQIDIGNEICDQELHSQICCFDAGDCEEKELLADNDFFACDCNGCITNEELLTQQICPTCIGVNASQSLSIDCNQDLNSQSCCFDLGNCLEAEHVIDIDSNPFNGLNADEGSPVTACPGCDIQSSNHIGDMHCDLELLTPDCCLDGGDCSSHDCPSCDFDKSNVRIGDNICQPFLNVESCCFDAGDCFPNPWQSRTWCGSCSPSTGTFFELYLMNGICEEQYNRAECCYDGEDCRDDSRREVCPTCNVENLQLDYLNNGQCDPLYDTHLCCFDGGHCLFDNDWCQSCTKAERRDRLEDGICDAFMQSPECCFDGGDCSPDEIILTVACRSCQVANVQVYLGNQKCDPFMDNQACCFDAGDCDNHQEFVGKSCHDCDRGSILITAGKLLVTGSSIFMFHPCLR